MHPQKRALITGITGQDGLYLGELLLAKGYQVYGLIRGRANPKRALVKQLLPTIELIEGDLMDADSLMAALEYCQPDEVYNLAAISFLGLSFKQPETAGEINGLGALRLLDAIRITDGGRGSMKFYQASTSEMFGIPSQMPQDEDTPFHPRSPYGSAKAYAHYTTVNYRETYGLFTCSGILYNHESPRRGHEFVTRKITSSVARIKLGLQRDLALGSLDSRRDWGFAGDYVEGMWRMLQASEPRDYVLATGRTHSIRELLDLAFAEVGIDNWKPYVKTDPRFVRPPETTQLVGNPSRAKRELGWEATTPFPELIKMMVAADLKGEGEKTSV